MVKTSSRNASPPSPLLSVGKCSACATEALPHRPTPAGLPGRGPRGSCPASPVAFRLGRSTLRKGFAFPGRLLKTL
jgi:hypothetical protein